MQSISTVDADIPWLDVALPRLPRPGGPDACRPARVRACVDCHARDETASSSLRSSGMSRKRHEPEESALRRRLTRTGSRAAVPAATVAAARGGPPA